MKKLGIRAGMVVALIGAPEGFEAALGTLPGDVVLRQSARGRPDLSVWFIRSRSELERDLDRRRRLAALGGLWVAWPKKSSGTKTDLTENVVRDACLEAGLVDHKICSIDDTWSGLRFAPRRRS